MKLYNNMIDLLADVKDRDREIRFIDGENDESVLGFADLWNEALALLGSLQKRGMLFATHWFSGDGICAQVQLPI